MNFRLAMTLIALLLSSCTTAKYIMRSNPEGAQVFFKPSRSEHKILLGTTPFDLTEETFSKTAQIDVHSISYFELVYEKEGYRPERLMVPGARFGALSTTVMLEMKESVADGNIARELIQLVMNAQNFANQSDFPRAHTEADKALAIDPKFARAHSMKGAIYFMEHNYPESLKWYEKALELDSRQTDVVKMIGHLRKAASEGRNQ